MAKSSAVAKLPEQGTALTTGFDEEAFLREHEGEGQDFDSQDLALPFLQILQKGSPQVNKRDGAYVEGAEAGMILNTVTKEVYDGEHGILVIPVHYTRKYVEWRLRENQGGFVGDHGNDESILAQTHRDEKNRDMLPNGNQVVTTPTYLVLMVKGDGDVNRAVLTMTSTQLKKSKQWNIQIQDFRVRLTDGTMRRAPSFYRGYRLSTVPESNAKGDWFGWKVRPECLTKDLAGGADILAAAGEFHKAAKEGSVKISQPSAETGNGAPTDEEIPF